jgi:hypothetical protein
MTDPGARPAAPAGAPTEGRMTRFTAWTGLRFVSVQLVIRNPMPEYVVEVRVSYEKRRDP